ncbi:MAG: alpha-L-arabinofuranosidase, partial [Pyrinomonadaceae bacterium]|nr:alpha-L-arabinofuranosidase [Sphingobacteriaceae bacterium]
GYYASATIDKNTQELIIKVVNNSDKSRIADFTVEGASLKSKGTLTSLVASSLEEVNTFDNPADVSPKQTSVSYENKKVHTALAPYSFNVIRIKMN